MTSCHSVTQVHVVANGRPTIFAGVAFRGVAKTQPAPLGAAALAELEALRPQSLSASMLALLESLDTSARPWDVGTAGTDESVLSHG